MPWDRNEIAARGAREAKDGEYVNLGIGIPTLIPYFLPTRDRPVMLHSENGLLGIGPFPEIADEDPDLINAGKEPVTLVNGSAIFDSAMSFAIVRGGHLDLAILGGMQVSQRGDLANWMAPGQFVKGMGGAMDIVRGARRTVVLMFHRAANGQSKVVTECSMPLTGARVVDRIITDLCVLDIADDGLVLRELAPGTTIDDVRRASDAAIIVDELHVRDG